jgi:UDP-N-acetyl-D-galactosamine dehydrogenase
MDLFDRIKGKEEKISVIGLGYVGMPIAVAFAKNAEVIGFDLDEDKINVYKSGIDPTGEVGNEEISKTKIDFTSDETKLREAKFHIVAVPTPINSDKTPNLSLIEKASEIVGRNLTEQSIVVYESTVYPGVTEDICIPLLEKRSGLKCGIDFKVGYSPERINPGDKEHRLENIIKIVSGIDKESLETISAVYNLIIEAGIHKVSSIKVAEAAKVAENSQRDINIAFMNELAMVFERMNIDTREVIEAMNTKWNALEFYPGLVGGHCIGVDPYYFIYEAEKLGYHSQIILSGRKINNGMGKFVAEAVIKKLVLGNKIVKSSKIAILGVTFKENTPDTRNSKVVDIVYGLNEYGINPIIVDPIANREEVKKEHKLNLSNIEDIRDIDCLIIAVAHKSFLDMGWEKIDGFFGENNLKIIIDVKAIFDKKELENRGYIYWRL